MSSLENNIRKHFIDSIKVKTKAAEELPFNITVAGKLIVDCLKSGGKILACGNGGSACDAMHFAAELVNRFVKERRSLPAIALTADTATITAIANDYGYDLVFSKQLAALGNKDDVLLAISTSGNSKNVINAIEMAQSKGLSVIALTGNTGGKIGQLISAKDIEIRVTSDSTPRIQEVHLLIIHCLCDIIDGENIWWK
jgi:phosphoheptose isomerase